MKTKKLFGLLTGIFLVFIFTTAGCQSHQVAPTDPDIIITGRTMLDDDENVLFDWPGISIECMFRSSEISICMDDTKRNFYNVFLDGSLLKVIEVSSDTTVLLADQLTPHKHKLLITKRTEGMEGIATFKGFVLSNGGEILPSPERPDRKIEFIGNSITCGYGTEAIEANEPFKAETENNYKSYAPITARAFGAEAHIIAHSGQGVVRNYGYKLKQSEYTMPDRYLQVFDNKKEPLWDFSSWKPNLVVINLGTNDFSTQPQPDEELFVGGYVDLIETIRAKYGALPIFCIVGPMTNEPSHTYVKKMVEEFRSTKQDRNVYFIGIPNYLLEQADWGAYHPKYSGQIKIAGHVVPVISSVMGWDYGKIE